MDNFIEEYCTCDDVKEVYTKTNSWFEWDVCASCDMPIKDSIKNTTSHDED